jgi:modification methylase
MQLNIKPEDQLSEEFIKQVSWSVWDIPVSTTKGHPAPFPDSLPERLIKLYTFKNDTVLDPFGGSGTTMKVARDLNRNSITYEINPEYIEIIKDKLNFNNASQNSGINYEIKIRQAHTD